MSSLWTPEGEQPVGRAPSEDGEGPDVEALRSQIAQTPAAAIVASHCVALWELAALHLTLDPPRLDEASVAIDALGAVVEALNGRLGEDEATLRDGLASIRLAFVQVRAVGHLAGPDGAEGAQESADA